MDDEPIPLNLQSLYALGKESEEKSASGMSYTSIGITR